MIERKVNILSDRVLYVADGICFTSNGIVKTNNELTMGAGIAKQIRDKWPGTSKYFGSMVKLYGNHVHYQERQVSYEKSIFVFSFPTKNHWRDPSDLELIKQSATELVEQTDRLKLKTIYLPFPGIGLGGLNKSKVRKIINPILDNRFIVCCL